ncbi:MAG: hypothetical protein ACXWUG_00935 [Polyangiales bacterium]
MLRDELIPALEYATYATGWRHAPRLLSWVERTGHRLRNRALEVELHRGTLAGEPLAIRVFSWDRAFAADLVQRVAAHAELSSEREPSVRAGDLDPGLVRGEADLTFVEVPGFRAQPFLEAGLVCMPKRVAHVESLRASDPSLVKRIRREMEERDLSYTLTRDLARFHRDIYLPFANVRHGVRARPTPRSVLELVMLRARVLEVRQAGRTIAGAVIARGLLDPDRLEIVVIGARDPDDEVARTAPVVFARDLARREGFLRCDHLGSSPFFSDGVFRRKRRYGTVPEDMSHREDRVLVDIRQTSGARAFLEREPFFVLAGGALRDVREVAC